MAHILVIDDDEIVAELASEILISEGHACGWVTNTQDAERLLQWRRPDVLLLDDNMPGETGTALLRRLRQFPQIYDLPVIMFTAARSHGDERRARFNGAQDYVRKPVDPSHICCTEQPNLPGKRRKLPEIRATRCNTGNSCQQRLILKKYRIIRGITGSGGGTRTPDTRIMIPLL